MDFHVRLIDLKFLEGVDALLYLIKLLSFREGTEYSSCWHKRF